MRRTIAIAAITLAAALAVPSAIAAGSDVDKTRADECRERAKTMKFGLHLIRRDRWIRECIKGKV